jgi:2-keto-4-pentenoate hydratase
MNALLQSCADALWQARATRTPIPPLRDWLAPHELAGAYAVQALGVQRRVSQGAQRVGRKIGLTSAAVQKQMGVAQPDFGVLFEDMRHQGASTALPVEAFIQPRIEGEIAFIVARDIPESSLPRAELLRRAGQAVAAFEIVDCAIAGWKITLADTVADNASCGAFVLGTGPRPLTDFDARLAGMAMSENGQIVSLGVGAASLGDPLNAFAWLADKAVALGNPLRAGEVVLTGALGPMVPFVKGNRYRLEIAGFAPLEVRGE